MLTEPGDLKRQQLVAALAAGWNLDAPTLEYLPVGFGSHHWKASDGAGGARFVTVDDLEAGFQAGSSPDEAFDALARAFGTAWWLRHDADLPFVVAAIRDQEGSVVRRLSERYAVSVLPFVAGTSSSFGTYETDAERKRVALLLGRLHAASAQVPDGLPRRDDLAIPSRDVLDRALGELGVAWPTGPFAEPTRAVLGESARILQKRLLEYDELARVVRDAPGDWVVTHGEPHRANVMESEGALHLVDWDTTMVAPRERDLWLVLDPAGTGLDEYAEEAGSVLLNEDALELYRLGWSLRDVAAYVDVFRRPHDEGEDAAKTFAGLCSTLRRL